MRRAAISNIPRSGCTMLGFIAFSALVALLTIVLQTWRSLRKSIGLARKTGLPYIISRELYPSIF